MADLIDPTKTDEYQVVLGETLRSDNNSNRLFTGFNYNHKPTLSSPSAPNQARLKPSLPGKTSSYDLSFSDNDGQYAFAGTRNTDKGQYVLWFDPARQVLVLDRIDSTLNMNITRMPENSDPDALSRRYPHLDSDAGKSSGNTSSSSKPLAANRAKSPPAVRKTQARKPEKKQEKKQFAHKPEKKVPPKNLALPTPAPKAPKQPEPKKKSGRDAESEEDEDDDDDGFQIEYPGGEPRSKTTAFSPAFASVRRFDEFMDQRESEADDADGESDGEPDADFKLPSPVNKAQPAQPAQPASEAMDVDEDEEEGEEEEAEVQMEDNLEDDLEKEMEMAFEAAAHSDSQNVADAGDESEISEED